jgi:hypothetical protein
VTGVVDATVPVVAVVWETCDVADVAGATAVADLADLPGLLAPAEFPEAAVALSACVNCCLITSRMAATGSVDAVAPPVPPLLVLAAPEPLLDAVFASEPPEEPAEPFELLGFSPLPC